MEPKRILLEFIGGDWDGKTLDSQSSDPQEAELARSYYCMTHQGTVGKAFHGVSVGQSERMMKGELSLRDIKLEKGTHKYSVVERLEEEGEVLVRIKYSVRKRCDQRGNCS